MSKRSRETTIRKARLAAGYKTQADAYTVLRRLGLRVGRYQLSRYETGSVPVSAISGKILAILAKGYGCSVDDLLGLRTDGRTA